jgi:hypothetical protein
MPLPALTGKEIAGALNNTTPADPATLDSDQTLRNDVRRLVDEAREAGDADLHTALYAMDDAIALFERRPKDSEAWNNLKAAITTLTRVADPPEDGGASDGPDSDSNPGDGGSPPSDEPDAGTYEELSPEQPDEPLHRRLLPPESQ